MLFPCVTIALYSRIIPSKSARRCTTGHFSFLVVNWVPQKVSRSVRRGFTMPSPSKQEQSWRSPALVNVALVLEYSSVSDFVAEYGAVDCSHSSTHGKITKFSRA